MAEASAEQHTCSGCVKHKYRDKDSKEYKCLVSRLRRIEGQVRGIARMVDGDADCIEILTQVAAVTHALEAAALVLVDQHLRDCLQRGAATTLADEQTKQVEQALRAVERLLV